MTGMKYMMFVTIADPDTPERMCSDITMKLKCEFAYDPDTYGKKMWLRIADERRVFEQCFDLRYDTSFDRNKKAAWLEAWAKSYWSGNDGAYAVKALKIVKEVSE